MYDDKEKSGQNNLPIFELFLEKPTIRSLTSIRKRPEGGDATKKTQAPNLQFRSSIGLVLAMPHNKEAQKRLIQRRRITNGKQQAYSA
jgi:hypothetical protein